MTAQNIIKRTSHIEEFQHHEVITGKIQLILFSDLKVTL